ncbi:MAG: lysozyme [Alphaproteobacteria bacterium]|nr:MAG: lysozyme [Alphaproteobacteria bacterium]
MIRQNLKLGSLALIASFLANAANTQASDASVSLIKRFEGDPFLMPGNDPAGILTLGYGHRVYPEDWGGVLAELGMGKARFYKPQGADDDWEPSPLDEPEAAELLRADITNRADVAGVVPVDDLTDNQIAALTSLAFNIGMGAFSSSPVCAAVCGSDSYHSDALGTDFAGPAQMRMLSHEGFAWYRRAGGVVMPGMIKRRFAEMYVFAGRAMGADEDSPSDFFGFTETVEDDGGAAEEKPLLMTISDQNWANGNFTVAHKTEAQEIAESV